KAWLQCGKRRRDGDTDRPLLVLVVVKKGTDYFLKRGQIYFFLAMVRRPLGLPKKINLSPFQKNNLSPFLRVGFGRRRVGCICSSSVARRRPVRARGFFLLRYRF